ncbi:MAG: type II toxin-antitoxin system VapC family toxin [Candidatus Hodarchaeales archaeon]
MDSDFIISLLREEPEAVAKAKELEEDGIEVSTTSINALELYVGIIAVDGISSKRVKRTRDFIDSLSILPLDKQASERSALILNSLKKTGQLIGLKDTLIAGIALENNSRLLTRNISHFERVPGLKIESW